MNAEAKRRVHEGVAALPPADRALLELAIDRGLPDDRIAELTGVDLRAVTERRERLLASLGRSARLSTAEVVTVLWSLKEDEGTVAPHAPAVAPTAPPRRAWSSVASARTRTATAALALTAVIAAVVVGLLGTTHSRHTPTATLEAGTTTMVTSTAPPPTTTTTKSTRTSAAHPIPFTRTRVVLRPLPGGPRRASGTARLARRGTSLILLLRVRGLRRRRRGHYEAFLYDSLLDSRALGRVRVGRIARLRLPRDARHFHSIDVSMQPRGVRNDSGESRLRGPNPARQAHGRGRPSRKRSTR